ncbi:cytoplasmic protein [Bacillus toyonensis]|uniref:cytoplasmic protein n=1 Tax=Bacillus toyonensis TaxID=155322 RepID=UPI000B43380B|nr:cytoplasmic protein [Bacillus toyonensis]OTX30621.1 cytoplasmic protein [Bacillus thuringiensis serovar malayensis]OUB02890.1 cytoplasmic protein [Bacillus thuringiensis serovar shandongiensis]MBH0361827.1 cytoplasmic protein [Bacillus toyonensis biovar Thuringiensis]MBX0354347.1 cytoplasmic protein [Bacillus toyonensis]MDM5257369.1 cytoplasmic protein [Bacillus toyonensis]
MSEFKKNPIATDEDYFELSSNVYDDDSLHKGAEIKGVDGKKWVVIESINADCQKVKNGLEAIAVVPKKDYKENATHYDDIILAFRGTEPTQLADFETDIDQITFGIKTHSKVITPSNSQTIKPNSETSFDTGLKWAKNDIVAKYNPSSLHTTGHSKGGAEADLIAAELDCYATTWAAPNPYRILSPEAKKRVDKGEMENKATDYTHENDPIGNHTQFGAPLIGKQYTVRQNDTKQGLFTRLTMDGHGRDTFRGTFHSNGSPLLKLEPEDIIRQAQKIQLLSNRLSDIAKNIEEFQRREAEAVQKLKSQLKYETGPGGKYHLLEAYEIDEAISRIAKTKEGGNDYFHDVHIAEELIHLLRKEQKSLSRFGDEISDAANSLRDKDNQLAGNFQFT